MVGDIFHGAVPHMRDFLFAVTISCYVQTEPSFLKDLIRMDCVISQEVTVFGTEWNSNTSSASRMAATQMTVPAKLTGPCHYGLN